MSDDNGQLEDWRLMREYAAGASQAAFAEVARRYVDFVYSTALRRVGGDAHLADDVTQAVFLILARKAHTIGRGVILSGWLHRTTGFAAANAIKRESRRRRHERAACELMPERREEVLMADRANDANDAADWDAVAPLLDGALDRLGAGERDAVLLRFIQGKSHRDVGAAMGISEDAARKRIERALGRLRRFFVARGVAVPAAAAIGALLATHAVRAAPAGVASAAAAVAPGTTVAALAKGVASTMIWAKAKVMIGAVAAVLLVGTTTAVAVRYGMGIGRPMAQANPIVPAKPAIAQGASPPGANVAAAARAIEGTVYGLDGEPLAGASVYLATPKAAFSVYAAKQNITPVVTGADGRFSFARPGEDWQVVVWMAEGFAQVRPEELEKSPMVFVRPWGRIEGRLMERVKPLAFQPVMVGLSHWYDDDLANCVNNQIEVKTDKDGRFVLDRVPPGRQNVAHRDASPGWGRWSKWELIDVEPGKVTTVEMGAVGRPVVGRLVVPAVAKEKVTFKVDQRHSWTIEAQRSDVPSIALPADYGSMTPRQRHRFRENWERTPEGQLSLRYVHAESTVVKADGTFEFGVLRPGKYGIYARALELDRPNALFEDVAWASASFTVPELPAGERYSDEAVALGEIALTITPRLVVGEAAPGFEVRAVDGKTSKLADYAGKLLVLHLHWQHMPVENVRALKKVYETFGKDPMFAMLSVHVDASARQVEELVGKEGLTWGQAMAARAALPEGYTRGAVTIYLIAPDGVLAGKVLDAGKLETAVAQALLERR
jgi:RNA polymerase sigma factor (sigma-70 family)